VVNDGLVTATNTVTVTVLTASQAVERLIDMVKTNAPRPNPLIQPPSAAVDSINEGNLSTAVNQLQAFQEQVRAQVTPGDQALAELLNRTAQEIIDALVCAGAKYHPRSNINSVERTEAGNLRLRFTGEPGGVYAVEASTNLVDWEIVGEAAVQSDGTFQFEDQNATKHETRFYRVVAP